MARQTLIYGFLAVGHVPVKLIAIVVFGAGITVYKMFQSLFLQVQSADPGRPLAKDEAPGSWIVTREVAAKVGTRPVDEIRLTPRTELAVYERGTRRERARDASRHVLILGVGVLNRFRRGAFRAVLAHEYGHFLGPRHRRRRNRAGRTAGSEALCDPRPRPG